jgi:hypothetical protein
VLLRSLPPRYKSFVKRFLRKAEPINLHQLMARIRLHEIEPSRVEIIDLAGIYLDRTCKKKHLAICAISGVAYRGCTVNKEVKLTRPVIVWLLLPTRFFSW